MINKFLMLLLCCRYYRYYFLIVLPSCFCALVLIINNFPKRISNIYIFNSNSLYKDLTQNSEHLDCFGDPLMKWCYNQIHLCNSSLIIFNKLFLKTNSIILNPEYAKGKTKGGEDLNKVLNQNENDEYFQFEKNFIQVIYQLKISI